MKNVVKMKSREKRSLDDHTYESNGTQRRILAASRGRPGSECSVRWRREQHPSAGENSKWPPVLWHGSIIDSTYRLLVRLFCRCAYSFFSRFQVRYIGIPTTRYPDQNSPEYGKLGPKILVHRSRREFGAHTLLHKLTFEA